MSRLILLVQNTTTPIAPIRFRLRSMLVGLIIAIFGGLVIWYLFTLVGFIPDTRIEPASSDIIQLDSFVLAGFIVGLFYFWDRHEYLWEKLGRRAPEHEPKVPLWSIPTVIGFVVSGLLGVGSTLTFSLALVEWALFFFVVGVCFGVGFWIELQHVVMETERALKNLP